MPIEPVPGSMRLRPDPRAADLRDQMLANDSVQQTIIRETLEQAEAGQIKESGRTICPNQGDIMGPLARYQTAVDLQSCPLERGGIWHTHVTPDEIRRPKNSVPDIANVVYGYMDVCVVSGTDTAEAVVAADDRDQMVSAFESAFDVDVSSPEDVTHAIEMGYTNLPAARREVRSALSPVIETRRTGYGSLRSRAGRVNPEPVLASMPAHEQACAQFSRNRARDSMGTASFEVNRVFEDAADGAGRLMPFDVNAVVLSTVVGTVVGEVVTDSLLNE